MPKDTAGKVKRVRISDLRKGLPPSENKVASRGNQALAVQPLPETPSTQKRPHSTHNEGPAKKKAKAVRDRSDASGTQPEHATQHDRDEPDPDQQAPELPKSGPRSSRRPQQLTSPPTSCPPSSTNASSPPQTAPQASSSYHPASSSESSTSSLPLAQRPFAETIGRMRAATEDDLDAEVALSSNKNGPSRKGKKRHDFLQPEDEAEDTEEDSVGTDDPYDVDGADGADDADDADEADDADDANDDEDGEEVSSADAQRFIKAIRKSKKKNKFQVSDADADPKMLTEHFKKWGRHCHRLCGLYTDIHKTIVCGMTVIRAAPHGEQEYEMCYKSIPNMSAATAKFYTKKFFHLCDEIPKFTALCEQILLSPEDVFLFAKYMQVHAAAGRTTDISTLKSTFHSYFPYVVLAEDHVIPPPGPGTLSNMKNRNGGYCSTATGRLVVPIDERADFDLDPPKFCKQKVAHQRKLQAANSVAQRKKRHQADRPQHRDDDHSYSSYLFPTKLKYDPTCPDRHIFKSELILSCFRHLFQGPSAVGRKGGARGLGRAPLVEIYNITKVTPDYLAYMATLLRHLLNTDDRWNGDDRQRSGHCLHTALHRLLTVEYEAWQEDIENDYIEESEDEMEWNIFAYYNDKMFGSHAGASDQQDPDATIFEDIEDENNIRAQVLKARTAALKARREQRTNDIRGASSTNAVEPRSRSSSAELVDDLSHFVDIPGNVMEPTGSGS
ncbi:hypothetical protein BD311DRAFT_812182 [Dichomitus squalens]|uniref:Uncharacterized protein n=1 Tax=Dichomitus squalens TaxID=114155 RepID=A0A4Q9M484_9APHY|nr:hypothetical protein BD311DRAFT_812182 [Dichomitus squalens]